MDKEKKTEIVWTEFTPADVEGKAWMDTEVPFGRIPRKMKDVLPDVYSNSHSSTGMCLFFDTNATEIHVRYELGTSQMGESNFNETAFSGVDLYAFDDEELKTWRWAAATTHFIMKPENQKPEYRLIGGLAKKARRYRLYLPMRNALRKFEVGVEKGASFKKRPPRSRKPLVYYGTSIIHGAFSTRAGLGVAQILGRNLDIPVVNLGFSGAARLEPEMAELLGEVDARAFVVDAYHNCGAERFGENLEKFIGILCEARPKALVYMLGAPYLVNDWIFPSQKAYDDLKTRTFRKTCRKMLPKYANLRYIDGRNFYGSEEVSMDGVHPNDEAFAHMAKILTRKLAEVRD